MADYKNTLNLPYTEFSMRGNLANREPGMLQHWYDQDLYGIIRRAKKGKRKFILHDGPPYANGNIHIGHSVNKILKDIIIKSKGLMGYDSPYVPGWDCHGLPIELKVEQLIGKPGEQVSVADFRAACSFYAAEQVEKQKKDYIRLGVLGDWEHPYLTMSCTTVAHTIRAFSQIIANGHLYKGEKPVHWCIDCRSTLAEAEVEYYDHSSPSIDVAFSAIDASTVAGKFGLSFLSGQISLLIWTTTPWTLPASRAITVHPDLEYHLVTFYGQNYIFAASLLENVMARAGINHWTVLGSIKGSALELLRFRHPFMEFDVPVILSKHVTLDTGTGAVHTAPDHGLEDYVICQQYGLEVTNSIGPDGCYMPGTMSALDGVQVFKANTIIIDLLRDSGTLLYVDQIKHSYPHCWRHKTPVIFRSTPQWFVSMDNCSLRKQTIAEIKKVQWIPEWGQAHILNMVDKRPDWCISRQRIWGVPMVLFVHNETEKLHPRTIELIKTVAQLVEQYGIQAWWDLDPVDILGDDAVYYHKIPDTLDVWFDSGATHATVVLVRQEFAGHTPDLYLEGADQYRGWFMSSLIISTAIYGQAPYRQVLTHGFTVDGQGRKMSKSAGNIVSSQHILDQLGADILRLWVASTDYTSEMAISHEIIKRSTDTYRRIRNTARFLLANLNGFDPACHSLSSEHMLVLDRWAVGRAQAAQVEIISAYDSYNFQHVVQRIMQFCSVEMGSFYLDVVKDRQYTTKTESIARRSGQTALYHCIESLVRWIEPIMPFTAHEIWGFMPGKRAPYIFTEEWYDGLFGLDNTQPLNNHFWQILLQVRSETNKIIEQARSNKLIGGSLEAQITLYAEPILANLLCELGDELCFILLTSSAVVADYFAASSNAVQCVGIKGLKIALAKANGKKCQRCWHYKTNLGEHADYPDICSRCVSNIAGPGETRQFV